MNRTVNLPFKELMNVLNRAQEVVVLEREGVPNLSRHDDHHVYRRCIQDLRRALAELGGRACPTLPVDAEASPYSADKESNKGGNVAKAKAKLRAAK